MQFCLLEFVSYSRTQLTGHSVDVSKTKVLAMESNTFQCHKSEAVEIRLRKPSLNRDNGYGILN